MAIALTKFITEEEYLALEEKDERKHEYFAGHVFAMAGASPDHVMIAGNVAHELRSATRDRCMVFSADLRVKVEATGLNTYADVTVVCGELRRAQLKPEGCLNPTVLVEVLSDRTRGYDSGEKW